MPTIIGTSPQFNFSNDFLANGLAGDLYGYGLDVGLSSNQAAYNASSIAAPLGSSNSALNNNLLGNGSDMAQPNMLNKIETLGAKLMGIAAPAVGTVVGMGTAANDKLKDLTIGRIATILAGIILIAFGLYYFGSSSLSSSIASLAKKVTE